jgi:putative ABC transport system substrate-binding protein
MTKQILGFVLSALLFALCVPVSAQQSKKIYRIGYLSSLDSVDESERVEAVRLGLRELGYTEGQNIAIEYRYAEGKVDQASEFAVELVRLKVDIIVVAGGTPWVQAAKNAAKTIPIVMVGGGTDPVKAGRPG